MTKTVARERHQAGKGEDLPCFAGVDSPIGITLNG